MPAQRVCVALCVAQPKEQYTHSPPTKERAGKAKRVQVKILFFVESMAPVKEAFVYTVSLASIKDMLLKIQG